MLDGKVNVSLLELLNVMQLSLSHLIQGIPAIIYKKPGPRGGFSLCDCISVCL